MISGILAGGIPGFRIELCCFPHPLTGPLCFCCGSGCCFIFMGLRQHGTQVVICMHRDDTKLSPLALIDLFSPINWSLSRHCSVVCVVFVCLLLFLWVCVLFVFGAGFGFCFLFLGVLLGFLDERDRA